MHGFHNMKSAWYIYKEIHGKNLWINIPNGTVVTLSLPCKMLLPLCHRKNNQKSGLFHWLTIVHSFYTIQVKELFFQSAKSNRFDGTLAFFYSLNRVNQIFPHIRLQKPTRKKNLATPTLISKRTMVVTNFSKGTLNWSTNFVPYQFSNSIIKKNGLKFLFGYFFDAIVLWKWHDTKKPLIIIFISLKKLVESYRL